MWCCGSPGKVCRDGGASLLATGANLTAAYSSILTFSILMSIFFTSSSSSNSSSSDDMLWPDSSSGVERVEDIDENVKQAVVGSQLSPGRMARADRPRL